MEKGCWKTVTGSDKEKVNQEALAVVGLVINDGQIVHIVTLGSCVRI